MHRKHIIAFSAGIFALVVMTATAGALIPRETVINDKPAIEKPVQSRERVAVADPAPVPPPMPAQQQKPACDDGNIIGTVVGGAAGGLVGSQIGSGSGQTVATIGGIAAGALLGKEYIPSQNVTCPK